MQSNLFYDVEPSAESEGPALASDYNVDVINASECADYILNIHYAKRWPSISYAYGLFRHNTLVGICTYGTPPSSGLRKTLGNDCIELNRLCLRDNRKNEASILVSRSLKLIPQGGIVVSFADQAQGHVGWVYQATNFHYYGLSEKRTDWKIRGQEHLHGITIADRFRGVPDRAKAIREHYGDDFYLKDRPRKHRYLYFTGTAKDRRRQAESVTYTRQPYPKSAV